MTSHTSRHGSPHSSPHSSIAACLGLVGAIESAAASISEQRVLPDQLVLALKQAGAFRMLIPAAHGGAEVPFDQFIRLVQTLAQADASVAWCVNQAAVIGTTSLWLAPHKIDEIWSDPLTSVANGPPIKAQIRPDAEGFNLSGHWGFSSGCQHATRMMGVAKYSEGGYRLAYFVPSDVTFNDNWQVPGLRGTGSFEFRVQDLRLSPDWVADPAGVPSVISEVTVVPGALMFAVSFAALALGLARATLDDVLEIAAGKTPRFVSIKVADDPDAQRFIGLATAKWRAANAYLHDCVGEVFTAVRAQGEITHAQRSELRLAGTHVIRESADVVDLAYKVAGSTAIYQSESLQGRYQDMHVVTQHVQARESYYGLLGRFEMSGVYDIGPMS